MMRYVAPMSDFIERQGLPFLAHILRRLADDFIRAFNTWYPEIDMVAPSRTLSTLLALQQLGPLSVTELAALLSQSHPLVINWVRQLKELDLIRSSPDPADARRTILSLTEKGESEARKSEESRKITALAYAKLMRDADAEIFEALWRIERACREKPFLERLREAQDEYRRTLMSEGKA